MNSFLERIVKDCGLSPIFAEIAIRSACKRAGVDAEQLDPNSLKKALPMIEKTISIYLQKEEVKQRISQLRTLIHS